MIFFNYRNPAATREENIWSGMVSLAVVFLVLSLLVMPNGKKNKKIFYTTDATLYFTLLFTLCFEPNFIMSYCGFGINYVLFHIYNRLHYAHALIGQKPMFYQSIKHKIVCFIVFRHIISIS